MVEIRDKKKEKKREPFDSSALANAGKDEIRNAVRAYRRLFSERERRDAARAVTGNLVQLPVGLFTRTQTVSVYLSIGHELPMRYLIRAAWSLGKTVCVPSWKEEDKRYRFALLSPRMPLRTGKFGVREPAEIIEVPAWSIDAVITPGLAFDTYGGRLGYGGGYYDRMFKDMRPSVLRFGVAYDWQLMNFSLPSETHDIRVGTVITEKRVVNCVLPKVEKPGHSET